MPCIFMKYKRRIWHPDVTIQHKKTGYGSIRPGTEIRSAGIMHTYFHNWLIFFINFFQALSKVSKKAVTKLPSYNCLFFKGIPQQRGKGDFKWELFELTMKTLNGYGERLSNATGYVVTQLNSWNMIYKLASAIPAD